ncbi:family 16 glycosylhydrolase [Gayadomonas joobiniege]|uniref:family 16 glycosylhydrolase n=1 Tax=Gayadomonas joobiniege TaxID=1234606 RepID=UPI00058B080B|nr:family 16 glycosylhydrolase [Gayadomonas joobiniege]
MLQKILIVCAATCLLSCAGKSTDDLNHERLASELSFANKVPLPEAVLTYGNWQLNPAISDDFNYSEKNQQFFKKWHDNHIRGWKGPGATYFSAEHSFIKAGQLVLTAAPVPADKQGKTVDYGNFETKKTIYTGFVTAKQVLSYPAYVEVNMKVSDLALANNFWLLSDDDRNEIDVTETYGDDERKVRLMATNYHIFKRDPKTNAMLDDYGHKQKHFKTPKQDKLNSSFHRFGFLWLSPTKMQFFLDGKAVRELSLRTDLTDPEGHYFDRPMRIIFDMEDHVWRARKGISPSKSDLMDVSRNKMYIDWIRTYQLTR